MHEKIRVVLTLNFFEAADKILLSLFPLRDILLSCLPLIISAPKTVTAAVTESITFLPP